MLPAVNRPTTEKLSERDSGAGFLSEAVPGGGSVWMISDVFSREATLAESRGGRYSPDTSTSTTRQQQQQQSNTFPTSASTQSVRQEDGQVLPGRSVMSPGGEAKR